MTAKAGVTALRNSSVLEVRLPWWATLSTSTCWSSFVSSISRSTWRSTAGEQEASAAISYAQNQGIVVLRLVVGDVVRKRGEHFDLGASEWEAARGLEGDDAGVYGCGLLADGLPDGALGGSAGPDLPGVEIGDQGGESADMVVVGVGHGDDVQAAEAAFPEIGRDYIFTDIELRGGPRS